MRTDGRARSARELGPRRFLLLNFDALCLAPEEGLQRILDFLRLDPDEATRARALALPRVPKSRGRHRNHDLSSFPAEERAVLAEFGFAEDD